MALSVSLHAQDKQPAADSAAASGKGVRITGKISDASTGLPIPGININIPESGAALSDDKGNFVILAPDYNGTLNISGQGYQNKEVPLRGNASVKIALHEAAFNSAFTPVIMPYSATPNSQQPLSVSSLIARGNWERPYETADGFLQGQVSGLNAIRRSGTFGIGAELFMRGFSSLYGSNQPLVLVDGMIYDINNYGNSLISGHSTNPFMNIDLKDVDNITVIKDGSSMYGTKGANGVILITTAHARELATKIDAGIYAGTSFAPKKLPVMNSGDFRVYLSELMRSSGMNEEELQSQPYMNDDPSNPDYFRYHNHTDWQDKVMSNGYSQNVYLKVAGGDNIAKYALSLGYLKNDGIITNSSLKRYNTRFNADIILSSKLTANTNLSFTSNEQLLKDQGLAPYTNPLLLGLIKAPFLPENEVSEEGVKSPNLADTDIFNTSNPLAVIDKARLSNNNYRFFGSVKFNYQFSKYLAISSLTGITNDKVRENFFIPRLGITPDTLENEIAYSRLGSRVQRLFSIYNDTYLSYKRAVARGHDLAASLGLRYNNVETEQDLGLGFNSATDDFVSVGNGVNTLRKIGGNLGKWTWINTYFSLNYNWMHKYFVSVNVAADGSSRFGKEIEGGSDVLKAGSNRFALMPSIAASWLVSSEKFMSAHSFIDLLKLRASYSKTGNDDIGNYSSRQYYVEQNLLGAQGLVRGNIGNSGLQWETNEKLNAGLDVAVSADIYRNSTFNMLVYEPLLTASGMQYVPVNNGGMVTNGIDLSINSRIIDKAVKWDLGINIGTYKNKISSLPGDILTEYAGATILTAEGRPASQFYGYKTNGVFVSDAEAATAGLGIRMNDGSLKPFRGGDMRFADLNTDKVIDENDRTVIGDPNPDLFGGISSRVSWKRFTLNALFTFSKGNDVYNYPRSLLESVSRTFNQSVNAVNRWRFDGQVTDVPKTSYGDPMGNARFSDRWIEDGSYFRLRTVSLAYDIPVKPRLLRYTTLYATANNLFTLTKYLGYDPEFSAGGSPLMQGIDIALEPQTTSIQLGIRFGL
jgi:TonB-linked SusC/RagA family outer membrane protein